LELAGNWKEMKNITEREERKEREERGRGLGNERNWTPSPIYTQARTGSL